MARMVLTFIGLYCLLLLITFLTQRSYIYFPDKTRPDLIRAKVADMEVIDVRTSDGLTLEGWYKAPRPGKPVLLMFHGNGGNIEIRGFKARYFIDHGYGVLMAEYRGYGGNEGKPSEAGFARDAQAYYDALTARGFAAGDIVIHGESLGTGVAVRLAAENPGARALVLEAPFTSLARLAQHHMPWMPVYVLIRDRYDSARRIAQVDAPVLILHGQADTVVPYKFGQRLFDKAREPRDLETFPRGGHINLYNFGAGEKTRAFLEEKASP